MKYGARNQLSGKVVEIKRGTIMGQVKFKTAPGSYMTSVMTLDSLDDMKLKVGDSVKAVFKAINVLLIKE